MKYEKKLIICGVGGQGVIYMVRLLTKAAEFAGVPVSTGEIHGLSQKGGMVNADVTFGSSSYGHIDPGQADYMIGLEELEAQRCVHYLKPDSCVVIDRVKIPPSSVNAGQDKYPDTDLFVARLEEYTKQVIVVKDNPDINPEYRVCYILGVASLLSEFPIGFAYMQQAVAKLSREESVNQGVTMVDLGRNYPVKREARV